MGFSESFKLVKACFSVLNKNKQLILFPAMSIIALVLLFISFIVPAFLIPDSSPISLYLLLFLFYVLAYFIVIFFNTGLIACAHKSLNGGKPTIGYGMATAFRNVFKIFIWAVLAATVGMILREISERSELFGKIVIAIIGSVWSLLTFFVVPVMIFENMNVFAAIRKSGSLLKSTWGENLVGSLSLTFFFIVLGLLGLIPLAISFFLIPSIILYVFLGLIIYWIALGVVSASLDGIFVAALYTYATTGSIPTGIDSATAKRAFRNKKQ